MIDTNNKEIKQLKRFLKGISDSLIRSKTTNSIYYNITRENIIYKVRFSDHLENKQTSDIDIILTSSNILIIKTNSGYHSVNYYDISYVKSFFLLLPNVFSNISGLKNQITEQGKQISSLNREINRCKKLLDFKEAYALLTKCENQTSVINSTEKKLIESKLEISKLNKKITDLNNKLKAIKSVLE
jgi:uncharacterized coiled-coil protein SlyX